MVCENICSKQPRKTITINIMAARTHKPPYFPIFSIESFKGTLQMTI